MVVVPADRPHVQRARLKLVIWFLLVVSYSLENLLNGMTVADRDSDRSSVYALLAALISVTVVFTVTTPRIPKVSPVVLSLALLGVWVALLDLLSGADRWISLVHVGLLVWWITTYEFMSRLSYWSLDARRLIPFLMFAAFLAFTVAEWYSSRRLNQYVAERGVTDAHTALNVVYYLVAVAPLALTGAPRWRLSVIWIVLVGGAAFSLKRGALIAVFLMILAYFSSEAARQRRGLTAALRGVLYVSLLACAMAVVDKLSQDFLSQRFTLSALSDGSGRQDIYSEVFSQISAMRLDELVRGVGSGVSISYLGTGAHNDFLAVLADFGLVGLILHIAVLVSLLSQVRDLARTRSPYFAPASAAIVAVLVMTLVSGVIFVHSSFFLFCFFGFAMGGDAARSKTRLIGVSRDDNWHDVFLRT